MNELPSIEGSTQLMAQMQLIELFCLTRLLCKEHSHVSTQFCVHMTARVRIRAPACYSSIVRPTSTEMDVPTLSSICVRQVSRLTEAQLLSHEQKQFLYEMSHQSFALVVSELMMMSRLTPRLVLLFLDVAKERQHDDIFAYLSTLDIAAGIFVHGDR